jgi:Lung seven transmembrane receptor
MWRCRILAIAHFIFAIIFAIGSMLVTPESASPWILLIIVPLTATTTTFYVWIISSLNGTIRDLAERKQTVKMTMYKRVWGLLLWSVLVLFSFFFLNVAAFAQSNADDFAPENWKSRWSELDLGFYADSRFFLDGWLNVLYLVVFATIVYIIRPTANNKRFAMSDEVLPPITPLPLYSA